MDRHLATLLILSVTLVLITLLVQRDVSGLAIVATLIVLVTLILVIGKASKYLPEVISAIMGSFRRIS